MAKILMRRKKALLAAVFCAAGGYGLFRLAVYAHSALWASSIGAATPAALKGVSPTQPRPPASAGEDQEWQDLVHALTTQALAYPGLVGIYIKDLRHDRTWAYHADDLFPSASLIKVPVMAAVFQKIQDGEMSLSQKLILRRRWRMGGSGSLKWYRDGTPFAVRDLLEHMITESDNTALRMLVDTVGIYYMQQTFPRFGLVYTQIHPEGLSLTSRRVAYENYTTAREMASLLEKMYRGELVSKVSSELMLDVMKRQRAASRLAKGLPAGWEIAHKTGLLRKACHDVGIVFSPHGDFVIAVLTGQNKNYKAAKGFITRLARLTYRHYKIEDQDLASAKIKPSKI